MECLLCRWVCVLQVVGFYYKQLMLLPMLAFAVWPWLTRREQLDQVKHQHRLTLASFPVSSTPNMVDIHIVDLAPFYP